MSTGGGHSKVQETMGVLGVPVMHARIFINSKRDIVKWWQKKLEEVMAEAGKEYKCLPKKRGDYHQGIPAITVIVSVGWSKKWHRNSYYAKSGIAIITGQATGKLLYIRDKNQNRTITHF